MIGGVVSAPLVVGALMQDAVLPLRPSVHPEVCRQVITSSEPQVPLPGVPGWVMGGVGGVVAGGVTAGGGGVVVVPPERHPLAVRLLNIPENSWLMVLKLVCSELAKAALFPPNAPVCCIKLSRLLS